MNMCRFIIYIFFIIVTVSCINAPDYPNEPFIEYIGISKATLDQNSLNTDSLFLNFSFTDGDGDLGHNANDTARNIFIKDLRTGKFQDKFKSPFIPEEGIGNGITGDIRLLLFTTCCLFPENIPPCSAPPRFPLDTVIYEVSLRDRAGNLSNKILTEPITIRCIN